MHALRKLLSVLLAAGVLLGCDSLHRDQVRVKPFDTGDADGYSRQDASVTQALANVAQRYGFSDSLQHARSEGVLAYFTEDSVDFPIAFGVRRIDGELIVEMRHFLPGTRESPRYIAVRSAIVHELTVRLGADKAQLLEREQYVQ
jgi:hypothetical protein